ncbi:hypothetical protein [Vibrio splendidus]|uniref:hypothetical protein n=1 Tax=Vibrio splendidus TaxID=29497 RepID=UPI0010561C40|nr:hypothetical protein [Vibrio splendidus]
MTKGERLKVILEKLKEANPANDRESANKLIKDIVNSVEDEFSGLPFNMGVPNDRMYFYSLFIEEWQDLDKDPCHINLNGKHRVYLYNNGAIKIDRIIENPNIEIFSKSGI